MTARPSSAFVMSASLHGAVAVFVLIGAWIAAHQRPIETTQIFELVAGEGNNYTATEAPLGGSSASSISTNIDKIINRSAKAAEQRTSQQIAKAQAVEPVVAPTTPTPTATKTNKQQTTSTITEQQFRQQNPTTNTTRSNNRSATVPKVETTGIAGGVRGGSASNTKGGAGGKALSRPDGAAVDAYLALLLQRLRDAHQLPAGLSDRLQAQVEFRITASGAVTGPRIISSSGNALFDQSVLAAFQRMDALGTPPAGFNPGSYNLIFKMRDDV